MCVCVYTAVKDLVLIPVHTKPVDSEKELDELYDVCMAVMEKWKTDVSDIYCACTVTSRRSRVELV